MVSGVAAVETSLSKLVAALPVAVRKRQDIVEVRDVVKRRDTTLLR